MATGGGTAQAWNNRELHKTFSRIGKCKKFNTGFGPGIEKSGPHLDLRQMKLEWKLKSLFCELKESQLFALKMLRLYGGY